MTRTQRNTRLCSLVLIALLTACNDNGGTVVLTDQQSQSLQPANTQLASIYNRSCKNCHTQNATGAPLTGDSTTWGPRLDKGMDQLLDSVINGFGGMPPLGLCMDCEPEQFEALIKFMAQPAE